MSNACRHRGQSRRRLSSSACRRMHGFVVLWSSCHASNAAPCSQSHRIDARRHLVRASLGGSSNSGDPIPAAAPKQAISGFTPANFISFSDKPEHRCHHLCAVEVEAPASVCFALWNDWNRLVEFLDLIAQVGVAACVCAWFGSRSLVPAMQRHGRSFSTRPSSTCWPAHSAPTAALHEGCGCQSTGSQLVADQQFTL